MSKLLLDVYAHNWGFLIPCKSGVVFTQQTGGISCHQSQLEGVFYPLQKPRELDLMLLPLLQEANYNYQADGDLWDRIKKAMHFDFEIVDSPIGETSSTEGFMWIKLTKFEPGWGHCDWVTELIGKTMVLIYPNSD
jgi:hypothetical protein